MAIKINGKDLKARYVNGKAVKFVMLNGKKIWEAAAETAQPTTLTLHLTSELTQTLYFTQSAANGVTIDWGDGSAAESFEGTASTTSGVITYAVSAPHTYTTPERSLSWSEDDYASVPSVAVPGKNYAFYKISAEVIGAYPITLTHQGGASTFSQDDDADENEIYSDTPGGGVMELYAQDYEGDWADVLIGVPSAGTYTAVYADTDIDVSFPSSGTWVCGEVLSSYIDGPFSVSGSAVDFTVTITMTAGDGVTWYPGAIVGYDYYSIIGTYGDTKQGTAPQLFACTMDNSVTSLEACSFFGCTSLTRIAIPPSITEFNSSAFAGCIQLSDVLVDANNLSYSSIGGIVFDKDEATLIYCPQGKNVGDYTPPASVNAIGNNAFKDCTKLTGIALDSRIETIGAHAFQNTSITSITLPDNAQVSMDGLFSGCTRLKDVVLGAEAKQIQSSTFSNCSSLEVLDIPSAVTIYGKNNVKGYMQCFEGCTSLLNFRVNEANEEYKDIDGVLYTKDGATMLVFPPGRSGDYTVPAGIEMNYYAMANNKLTSVKVPQSTYMGTRAYPSLSNNIFVRCKNLKTAEIAAERMYGGVFEGCSSLEKVWLRNTCTSIPVNKAAYSPFNSCNKDCRIYVEASSKPSGYGDAWNNISSSVQLSVTYGQTTSPF